MDAARLPLRRLLNVVFVIMTEQVGDFGNNRDLVIERFEEAIGETGGDPLDRETWGTSPSYVESQKSIMGQHGPPPGWAEKMKRKG